MNPIDDRSARHFRQSDSVDLLIDRPGIHDAAGCDRPDLR